MLQCTYTYEYMYPIIFLVTTIHSVTCMRPRRQPRQASSRESLLLPPRLRSEHPGGVPLPGPLGVNVIHKHPIQNEDR